MALIAQADPERPGVVACELGLAPESLDEYRTRIDGNARRGGRPGTLVRNEVVKTPKGDRLESLWEFRPAPGSLWRELSVRVIANRQMYTFVLNADDATYAAAKGGLRRADRLGRPLPAEHRRRIWWIRTGTAGVSASSSSPSTSRPSGVRPSRRTRSPCSTPTARRTGSGPTTPWCSPRSTGRLDLQRLAETLPDRLREEEPNCEVLSCKVIAQGKTPALETVVRTRRGPFSMTVLERRFAADRFDYEVKYTVESEAVRRPGPDPAQEPRQLRRAARRRPRRAGPAGLGRASRH